MDGRRFITAARRTGTSVHTSISSIDLGIIGAYLVLVLGIGFYTAIRTRTGEDLFLGGRTLTWGCIGLSLFASNISSNNLIGLAGAAYTTGISVSNYEWFAGVPLIIMAFFYIPLYLKSRITTIPEFLELRFNRACRTYFSAVTILLSVVVDTAGGLYAGALVVKVFYPGAPLLPVCFALALVAGLYTAFGGLKAVVYTDAIQAAILLVGSVVLTFILFGKLGFSWATVREAVPEGHLSLIRPLDDPTLPWLGTLVGVPVLGFWYWVTNQYIVQRVLGAKNVEHARWGAMLAGFLKVVPFFTMVLPGVMAIKLFPGLKDGDMVYPTMITQVLPVGLVGLVLAGLVSAIMSSIDSTLNSASTLVVCDFIEPYKPGMPPERVAWLGRITTIVIMVLVASWAPLIARFGGLFSYLQQAFSILVPPVAAIFLIGPFWKRGNGLAAFATLIIGHVLGAGLFCLGQMGIWTIHFTINVGIMTAVSAAAYVGISLVTAPPAPEKVAACAWTPALAESAGRVAWYKNYRIHSAVLLAVLALLLAAFW
ncbi:MAG: sodium:solute symporter [Candidatus Hydrogenedentes bacterium]|nr:sodium:solute symporter [Candidatus Hydrogenedentota bacterium]